MEADPLNLTRATIRGTLWTYLSYYSGKLLVFISTVILARLLLKEDFGVAGYAVVVIGMLEVLSDMGVGPALIYHRDDPEAADTAFWLSLFLGLVLLALTWLLAPFAGTFFNDERAIPVTQVLALTFPLSALSNVHRALLSKELAFGRKFVPSVMQMVGKGVISIALAVLGFGAWSLVLGQVAGQAVAAIVYWRVLPWRPRLRLSRRLSRALLDYGTRYVSVGVLAMILLNADNLFVGRFLGAEALGVYALAFRIPELIVMQFCNVIAQVIFPVFTKMRDDPHALRRGFLSTTRYVSMVTVPLSLGLALVAEPFVLTLYTAKWAEAIPVLRGISIYALFLSLAYNAGDVYKAQGRLTILTKLSLVRAVILLPALWWAVTVSGMISAVAWTHAGVAFIGGALNLVVAGKMLNMRFGMILASLYPALTSSALMVAAVVTVLQLLATASPLAQLAASVAAGALAYGGSLWWLQRDVVRQAGNALRTALVPKATTQ